ncbi:MAG: V-type ATP synthase subunit I, partial [Eubacteriales bacterium]
MIAGMKKLTLAAPKSDIDALCAELVWLEAVETTDFHPDAFGETGLPEGIRGFDNASALSEAEKRLSRLQNAIETLAPYGSGGKKAKILPESFTRKEFEALADKSDEAFALVERTENVSARLAGVRAAIARAENDIASLAPFLTFDEPVSMEETRYTRILKGTFPKLVKPDAVRAVLDEAGFDYELNEICETGDYRYVYAITPKEDAEAFGRALNGEGFARILLTGYEGTARDETAALKEKIAGFEAEVNDCFRQYREIAVNRTLLEQVFDYLNSRVSAEHVKQKLLATDSACLLTGWVPNDRLPALEDKLAAFDCCYTLDEPKDTDKVPVKLVNKRLVTPFESVLGLYSYPDYKGVDPTFVMSIFYFIIFGLIMQDVVYGLILLIGGKALIKALRAKPGSTMYKMLDMFSICGVSTMICGVLFGGYFGDLPSAFARNMLGITDFPEIAVAFNPVT